MNNSDLAKFADAEQNWDVTVQKKTTRRLKTSPGGGNGCIVQIHPLVLENKMLRITQSKTIIGRDPKCDIFCDDSSISRKHAMLLRTDSGFAIEDCGSTNGTFVDGNQVSKQLLTDGNQIQVGNHIFKFLAGDSIEHQYHETVYSMMTKDGLTNVYNKRYLIDAISREFDRSQTYGRPFSLVMMDIDFFKSFNDTYGHLAGDEVLQEFAKRIQAECSPEQIFGRFGGEEFSVLLIETGVEAASDFAEKLRMKICSTPFDCCAGSLDVAASFGVAQFSSDKHTSFSDIVEEADQNLYLAKEGGRNRVSCGK